MSVFVTDNVCAAMNYCMPYDMSLFVQNEDKLLYTLVLFELVFFKKKTARNTAFVLMYINLMMACFDRF